MKSALLSATQKFLFTLLSFVAVSSSSCVVASENANNNQEGWSENFLGALNNSVHFVGNVVQQEQNLVPVDLNVAPQEQNVQQINLDVLDLGGSYIQFETSQEVQGIFTGQIDNIGGEESAPLQLNLMITPIEELQNNVNQNNVDVVQPLNTTLDINEVFQEIGTRNTNNEQEESKEENKEDDLESPSFFTRTLNGAAFSKMMQNFKK